MYNESRIDIYDYLYNIFYDAVTKNVYSMSEPQELTKSDTTEGFIVITVGDIVDDSEFDMCAYARARCFIQAYIPPITRGRLDYEKYKEYEDSINAIIHSAAADDTSMYHIQEDTVLSYDDTEESNANNLFFMFVKSFVVIIDKKQ